MFILMYLTLLWSHHSCAESWTRSRGLIMAPLGLKSIVGESKNHAFESEEYRAILFKLDDIIHRCFMRRQSIISSI